MTNIYPSRFRGVCRYPPSYTTSLRPVFLFKLSPPSWISKNYCLLVNRHTSVPIPLVDLFTSIGLWSLLTVGNDKDSDFTVPVLWHFLGPLSVLVSPSLRIPLSPYLGDGPRVVSWSLLRPLLFRGEVRQMDWVLMDEARKLPTWVDV